MIVATNNKGKLQEIKEILNRDDIYSLKDKNINIEILEDGNTFLENAKKKAKTIYDLTKEEVIADDSGLCINCLDGYPGVNTHRFLGNATDIERNEYLINKVNQYNDRSCKFICVIIYYDGSKFIEAEGILNGFISKEMKGNNGFGFDSIFELSNGKTLAQLSNLEKNKISARYLALKELERKLIIYEV